MDNLRKFQSKGYQPAWTKEQILAGLQYFHETNNRYPTADEIDTYEYLPTSRSIQRSFGGLVKLRQELIPDSHHDYTRGAFRSEKAKQGDARARLYEEEFYAFLISNFEPIAIHEHKIIRPGNVASDFFIYLTEEKGVVIDLFYAQDIRTLAKIVNIKLKKYSPLPFKSLFILVGNDSINMLDIKSKTDNRKTALPSNIIVITEDYFKRSFIYELKKRSTYSINCI